MQLVDLGAGHLHEVRAVERLGRAIGVEHPRQGHEGDRREGEGHGDREQDESDAHARLRPPQRLPAQLDEATDVPRALPNRRLARAGLAVTELVGHLGDGEAATPQQDLDEDLEAVGTEPVEVQRLGPDEEAAAHRIGHDVEAPGEQHPGRPAGRGRHAAAGRAQRRAVASVDVAAGDDDVGTGLLGPGQELRQDLRRVLEVTVHHGEPRRARHRGTRRRPLRRDRPFDRASLGAAGGCCAPAPGSPPGRSAPACRRRCRRRRGPRTAVVGRAAPMRSSRGSTLSASWRVGTTIVTTASVR